MTLLIDIFAYLTVGLHALDSIAQSLLIGGIAFMLFLAHPLAPSLGEAAGGLLRRCARGAEWSAWALVAIETARIAVRSAMLMGTLDLPLAEAAGGDFVRAGATKIALALGAIALLRRPPDRVRLLLLGAGVLALAGAATFTSHAMARLDDRLVLATATALHLLGGGVWIGGLPYFLDTLNRCGGEAARLVGRRFSRMAMAAVGTLVTGALVLGIGYIGAVDAIYGTAYGAMAAAKFILLVSLLFLGAMNFLLVARLERAPATPTLRLRRFAEVEIGIGIAVFFAAGSLTSLPPAIDLVRDRVTLADIGERMSPRRPSLTSPDHAMLSIPSLQARVEAAMAAEAAEVPEAYVPGGGSPPPRNAHDGAWSEFNHNWAGIIVLSIALLALLCRTGRVDWARHWPLLFLALAAFLVLRSDPEVWPLGHVGLLESLRDPSVVQHRIFVLLITGFSFFEWRAQSGRWARSGLVFPLLTAIAGALLLTHTHPVGNVKSELLIELTHISMGLLGIAAGWARWLEIRLEPPVGRIAGWLWPCCFAAIGLLLFFYRES